MSTSEVAPAEHALRGQETPARVEEHRQIAEIEAIQSGDDWRQMLDVTARLHRYSAGSSILIAMQHAAAYQAGAGVDADLRGGGSHLEGRWAVRSTRVKAYAVLAPAPRQVRVAVTGSGPEAQRRILGKGEEPGPGSGS